MYKALTLGLAAAAALLLLGGLAFAYRAATQEEPAPEYIDKVYDLEELVRIEESPSEGPSRSPLDPLDVGFLDGRTLDESGQWWFVTGTGESTVSKAGDFHLIFDRLADGKDIGSEVIEEKPVKRARIRATAACHERIQWFLDAMRSQVRARLDVEVLRLAGKPARPVLSAKEAADTTGAMVSTARIRQGGAALFENVTERAVVYNFNLYPYDEKRLDLREIGGLVSGEIWRATAVALPNGRVRLQAAYANAGEVEIRKMNLPEGQLELPAIRWRFTPGAANIENGGGLALDCGGEHFLFRVRCDTDLPNLSREDGRLKLFNPAGAARAGVMAGRWLLRPIADWRGSRSRLLPQNDAFTRSEALWQTSLAEWMEDVRGGIDYENVQARLEASGPLVLRQHDDSGDGDPAVVKAARQRFDAELGALTTRPAMCLLDVVVYRLPKEAPLPDGVIGGKPVAADVAMLRSVKGSEVLVERTLTMEPGQTCDVTDLRLRNFLGDWQPQGDEKNRRWQPEIDTDVSGWQLRLGRDANDRTSVRFGLHELARIEAIEGTGSMKGRDLESPEGTRTEATLSVVAKPGEWSSVVKPLGEDARVVVCVWAVQP